MSRLKPPKSRTTIDAEALALSALVFITEDPARLARFLADSGLEPGGLAATASDPGTLTAVLGYLVSDESLLLVFADHAQVDPAAIEPARHALASGSAAPKTSR